MRRRGPHASPDDDVLDVVVLEEEREEDDYLRTLHAIAVAAMALRATSPGDPHPLSEIAEPTASVDDDAPPGLRHRLRARGTRLGVTAAVVAPAVVIGATVLDARHDAQRLTLLRADPTVLAEVTAPPVELWRADGSLVDDVAPVRPTTAPAGTEEEHDLPGDARATWSWAADGSFDRGLVVVGRERAYALPGPLLLPAVTDGSFPRTLLSTPASGEAVRGIALRTGERLWSWPRTDAGGLAATVLVDGVVLLDEGDAVTALDVRDGTLLWRTAVDPSVGGDRSPTDGVVVLLPVPGDAGPHLLAVRIADGTGLWRAPLPPGTTRLAVVDHVLVAGTADGGAVGLG
jgi:hypothetical protein